MSRFEWTSRRQEEQTNNGKKETMKNSLTTLRTRDLFMPLVIAAGLALGAVATTAGVLPPNSSANGRSYSEWSAAYWQWLFAQPVDGHPGVDSPDFDVTDGQSGRVWFLTGPFGTVDRDVTIPAGTSLFISLICVEASSLEEPPFYGATYADQLAIVVDCGWKGRGDDRRLSHRFATIHIHGAEPVDLWRHRWHRHLDRSRLLRDACPIVRRHPRNPLHGCV
jgi:hypothetical protein